jgi:hypothetical protein
MTSTCKHFSKEFAGAAQTYEQGTKVQLFAGATLEETNKHFKQGTKV